MQRPVLLLALAWFFFANGIDASAQHCVEDADNTCANTVDWGGTLRLRAENWTNFALRPDADDAFLLGRLLLHADIPLREKLSLFVQGKSALSTDRNLPGGTRPLDVDTLALQQAILKLRFGTEAKASTLLLGRQPLQFGRQRLVSPLPWGNSLRAWDGARLKYRSAKSRIDGFYSWYVPVEKYDRNRRDADEPFYGLYATLFTGAQRGLDAYWLRRERPDVSFNGTSGKERRDTLGVRLFHEIGAWRGEMEAARQGGSVGANDISAFMGTLEISRHWEDGTFQSIGIGLDYASGDESPGGGVETFDQLYPLGHAYLGYIDFIGRQNIVSAFLRGRFRLAEGAILEITGLAFERARSEDALYNPLGGVLRPAGISSSRHVGEEIDVALTWPIRDRLNLLVGYSHFFPGTFIEQSGPSAASNFVYVQATFSL